MTSTPRKLAFTIEHGLFLCEIYSSKVFQASAIARAIAGAIMELEQGLQLFLFRGRGIFCDIEASKTSISNRQLFIFV